MYTSHFATLTVAMIKGTTRCVPQTLKERKDLPLPVKFPLESRARAFQWLVQESDNHMLRNIEAVGLS